MMLQRLHDLRQKDTDERERKFQRPFANIGKPFGTGKEAIPGKGANENGASAAKLSVPEDKALDGSSVANSVSDDVNAMPSRKRSVENSNEEESHPIKKLTLAKEDKCDKDTEPSQTNSQVQMARKIHKTEQTSRKLSPRKDSAGTNKPFRGIF